MGTLKIQVKQVKIQGSTEIKWNSGLRWINQELLLMILNVIFPTAQEEKICYVMPRRY